MAIKGLDYWCDYQMKRFLEQIVRAFSGFQIKTGIGASGEPTFIQVPCTYAVTSAVVAAIMQNGSANTAAACPAIVVYQTGLRPMRERLQNPNHIDTRLVTERAKDDEGHYTNSGGSAKFQGNAYMVQRYMPRPFEIQVNVDIWTSNLDQKHQLVEQILPIFWPDITIQNSDAALDWTAMTTMSVEDIVWTSKTIPIGTNTAAMDICTIPLKLPMWISPPAKVKQTRIIQQVVANIYQEGDGVGAGDLMEDVIVTPGDAHISVEDNIITLLGGKAEDNDEHGEPFSWKDFLPQYGLIKPAISTLHLKTNTDLNDRTHDIVGTIQYGANPNELIWIVDPTTLPANTIDPVDRVIDPRQQWPGNGLPLAADGQRYLLLNSITNSTVAWGALSAPKDSIIQYHGGDWRVVTNPVDGVALQPQYMPFQHNGSTASHTIFVLNKGTGRQLRWTGIDWRYAVGGTYGPGMWRLHL